MSGARDAWIVLSGGLGLALGVLGFLALTPPGGRPGTPLQAIYHTLGLFVLNPPPRGLPAGEPGWALACLWAAHFLAPLSLASVAIDAARTFLARREPSFRSRHGHAIVCGLGRTALLCVEEIAARGSPADVVVLELHRDNPHLSRVRELGVSIVFGSMTDEEALRRAGIEGASRLLAFAQDDILNLNAATAARKLAQSKDFRVFAQALDARLVENLPDSLKQEVRFLNTHEVAAEALVRERRLARGYEDAYVVAGFGNFGQMLLKALLREDTALEDIFFVIDLDADQKVRAFLETFGLGTRDVRPVRGDLHDPLAWRRIQEEIAAAHRAGFARRGETPEEGARPREPLVLVCTDHDVSNLSLALSIRRRYFPSAAIHCRLFGALSFEGAMVGGRKIETFRVADLLRASLPADLFGRKGAQGA